MDRRKMLWLTAGAAAVSGLKDVIGVSAQQALSEAPGLAVKVGLGALPPLSERLPAEPLVLQVDDVPGIYGGSLRAPNLKDAGHDQGLLRRHYDDRDTFLPNIAKSFQWAEDFTSITFSLREGMKWSDGTPYTTDGIMFWWNDIVKAPWNSAPYTVAGMNSAADNVTQLDDYTVRFEFAVPRPNFLIDSRGAWSYGYYGYPRHYFQQYHPAYAPKEGLDPAAQFSQLLDRLFQNIWIKNDPKAPTILPWMSTVYADKQFWRGERNPYYFVVDTNGQQLPYMDSIESSALADVDRELIKLKLLAGEADMSFRTVALKDYPLYKDKGPSANFSLVRFPSTYKGTQAISFNQNAPDTKVAGLMQNADFRRALSLGIDRDLINEIAYLGLGKPGHGFSDPGVTDPSIDQRWAQYDPARANQMLDSIGLNKRDRDGFRTFADGSALTVEMMFQSGWGDGSDDSVELLQDNWSKLGIRVQNTLAAATLYVQRVNADNWQIRMSPGLGGITANWNFTLHYTYFAKQQADWWLSRSQAQPRGIQPTGAVRQLAELLDNAQKATDKDTAKSYFQQYRALVADQMFMMSAVMDTGSGLVTNARLRNVPGQVRTDQVTLQQGEGEYLELHQWYFSR